MNSMEYLKSILVMILVGLIGLATAIPTNDTCIKVSPCRCRFNNGSEINLMQVAAVTDPPRFHDLPAQNASDKSKYFYNPCYRYVYPPDGGEEMSCSHDVAVCQAGDQGFINIGNQRSTEFYYENSTHNWVITYFNEIGDRLTNVILQCSSEEEDNLIVYGETVGHHKSVYNMTLVSKCACIDGCQSPILPHGMSIGSMFLLVLFLAVCAYLMVGYVYRRFVIGARGLELLPHLNFWLDFPYLVQDGFFFLIYCRRRDVTYERI